jgi:hypothetical protein
MTYQDIIAKACTRPLKTVAPTLRLVPKHDDSPPDLAQVDVIAWAKARAARGRRLAVAAEPEPRKPRQSFKNNPELRYLVNRSGWWHFQKLADGKVIRFALKTRDLALAQARRDEFLNEKGQS